MPALECQLKKWTDYKEVIHHSEPIIERLYTAMNRLYKDRARVESPGVPVISPFRRVLM